jgi:hypothetical protein
MIKLLANAVELNSISASQKKTYVGRLCIDIFLPQNPRYD